MKSILLFLLISSLALQSSSQSNNSNLPVYRRFPNIPAFTIYKAPDSTAFTRQNLKKKPTVIIVFDPWCDHCQQETDSIIAHISLFKKAQILMVTSLPHQDMLTFYGKYKIARYPVITMGSDPKFFFPSFFQVRSLPGVFIYDKDQKLKNQFEGTVPLTKITSAL